jgi:hypothetical protein
VSLFLIRLGALKVTRKAVKYGLFRAGKPALKLDFRCPEKVAVDAR